MWTWKNPTVKGTNSASSLPPLEAWDHNAVYLRPGSQVYQRLLEKKKRLIVTVQIWNEDSIVAPHWCLDWTSLEVLNAQSWTNKLMWCQITLSFWVDSVVPAKTFKMFPNKKPWGLKKLKFLLDKGGWPTFRKTGLTTTQQSACFMKEAELELKRLHGDEEASASIFTL